MLPQPKLLHEIKRLKPDLISRAFACAVYINATSTPDQKNRTGTQKRGFAGNGVHQTRRLLIEKWIWNRTPQSIYVWLRRKTRDRIAP